MKAAIRKLRKAVACVLFLMGTAFFVLGAFADGDAIESL